MPRIAQRCPGDKAPEYDRRRRRWWVRLHHAREIAYSPAAQLPKNRIRKRINAVLFRIASAGWRPPTPARLSLPLPPYSCSAPYQLSPVSRR
jgi:hypothetical protein